MIRKLIKKAGAETSAFSFIRITRVAFFAHAARVRLLDSGILCVYNKSANFLHNRSDFRLYLRYALMKALLKKEREKK